ncbi:multiple monosaccharide ABC transporter substrate-binding protein [Cellulomonas triticagri]|uniref:Sugar ABC transporter substrate-binding protein n=1 Tax=Cellulomonas triticagri TaxID=2483352 RepID=A0A3M2J4H2_9CELL|nr:multiple monosaccharide ABC transporter substrate-binding protein [Cellulomonas triticagri]RMI06991.1 sugar ABC transporter substrate-binding protein [Cellulomonas triticagri]
MRHGKRHRRGKALAAPLVALAVLGTATACGALPGTSGGDGADGAGERPLVGVAMPTTTSERWIGDGENVQDQLLALGYDVALEYAENDVPTQVEQLEQMIADGADALVIGSIDGVALKGVLAEAAAADIPVIAYDRLINGSPDVDYYATFDNARVGVQQATQLLQGLGVLDAAGEPTGATGPFAVELFAGSTDDNNATVFYDGAMQVLRPYLASGVLTVASGETDFTTIAIDKWDPANATARMQTLLPLYASQRLDGVLSPYDGISRAVIDSVKTLGYGTADQPLPVVTGQDAELDSAKSIAAGEQYGTVYKDTRQLAEVTVAMVRALLDGAEPEVNDTVSYDNGVKVVPSYLLTPMVVDAQNYRQALVGTGYYTDEELG